jgi:hypothetical protein
MLNIRKTVAAATLLLGPGLAYAEILTTAASVRPNNSLIVDIEVTTAGGAAKLAVTYETPGVDSLVSRMIPVSGSGTTIITIGRLRAERTYTYAVRAIDDHGGPAGTARGSFTTGSLPAALRANSYTLKGRITVPLVILPHAEANFQGYVGLDLHSPDAPQIVWYYSNGPSKTGAGQTVDQLVALVRDRGNFLMADAASNPPPNSADAFYREIMPDGTVLSESPADCSLTPPPTGSPAPKGWIWAQGNDVHEQLLAGADAVPGTVLHLAKIVKDPFFDAGLALQGTRLQTGVGIRRWTPRTGKDTIVWDPFQFMDPLTERTDAGNSDPGANSSSRGPINCTGASLQMEDWMLGNSLQVAPTGVLLMSLRHLDTVIAISPQFDRIAWRVGRFGSDFSFPNATDRFYHQHYARMLENGNLLLLDNGNGRPAAEGGLYSRALELALDWESMTATKVWEYRHRIGMSGGVPVYKYADKVGAAHRLKNGNTLVLFGADIDAVTLLGRNTQTFTLVEADANAEAGAVAVLDMQIPGNGPIYRPLPVETLFGEVPGKQ